MHEARKRSFHALVTLRRFTLHGSSSSHYVRRFARPRKWARERAPNRSDAAGCIPQLEEYVPNQMKMNHLSFSHAECAYATQCNTAATKPRWRAPARAGASHGIFPITNQQVVAMPYCRISIHIP
eukprot:989628-Pleurochrysis_carterae.AAC.1